MKLKLYVASKSRHCQFWQGIRAAGLDGIISSWIDWPPNFDATEPTPEEWRDHWVRCCEEAASADILLLYAQTDEQQRGALIELGAALAANRKVFMVTPFPWSWRFHPNVTVFDSLADAIAAIRALQTEG